MKNPKKILVIHASDADQHLGRFKEILDVLIQEERIETYSTIKSNMVDENSLKELQGEDMGVVLLTNNIIDSKGNIETLLLDVKKRHQDINVVEILIDNVPYETSFIAFPTSLEPIRSNEDMDGVWSGISENFKKIFPKPVIEPEPEPVPEPVPPVPPSKPAWKKYLPYILGILALLLIGGFIIKSVFTATPEKPNPVRVDEKPTLKIVDVRIASKVKISKECPEKITGAAVIVANGVEKVKGRWLRSDKTFENFEYNLGKKEKVELNTIWNFGKPGREYNKAWLQLEILEPFRTISEKAFFDLQCPGNAKAILIVEDVFSIAGRGTVATGKVTRGTIKAGDQVYINDQGSPIKCTGIEKFRKISETANEGEEVGLLLRGVSKSDIKRGDKLVIR